MVASTLWKKVGTSQTLLIKTIGAEQAASKLQGDQLQHVHFHNRVSVSMHADFVDESIRELLRMGAIRPWDRKEPLTVINGLGVAVDCVGKKRLILDARFINLVDEYHKFSYESLADVPQYLKPDDFSRLQISSLATIKQKVHPRTHRFLAIQHKGQTYF